MDKDTRQILEKIRKHALSLASMAQNALDCGRFRGDDWEAMDYDRTAISDAVDALE